MAGALWPTSAALRIARCAGVGGVSGVARLAAIYRDVSASVQPWRRFGVWLLLGLEFELAADIIRSVIAPSWTDIGQLGAIAVIRTFLNYFLEKDLEASEASGIEPAAR